MGEICASGSVGGRGGQRPRLPGNLAGDAKGKGTSGSNREAESTDAPERGGLPRSVEVSFLGCPMTYKRHSG